MTVATAEMVAAALRPFELGELLVAGGGTRNLTLMAELQARLPGVKMRRTDDLWVPEAGKEALVFAIIGFLTLNGLPATVPSCTGAARASRARLGDTGTGGRGLPHWRGQAARSGARRRPWSSGPLCPRDEPTGAGRARRRGRARAASATRPGLRGTERPAPVAAGEPLLALRGVGIGIRRHRRASEIVRGVDLEVFPGEKLGIVGESGSGKSLTVLSVLRLLPDPPVRLLRGRITFAGQDLATLDDKSLAKVRGAEIAMVYQDPMTSLNPLLRVRTQIVETLRAHGTSRASGAGPLPGGPGPGRAAGAGTGGAGLSRTSSPAGCSSV